MTDNKPTPVTYFLTVIEENGGVLTFNKIPDELPEPQHTATNWDVYQAAKQIVTDSESQMLADRVANTVLGALLPPAETASDRVKDALKERGIDPESTAPTA